MMVFNPRQTCLWIHRYSGLVIAVFLIITSITGALLAFYNELDDVFNHKLAYSEVQNEAQLPISVLHDKVITSYPQYSFSSMPTSLELNKSAVFVVDKVSDETAGNQVKAPFQQVYVNTYTKQIIGTRDREQWAWRNTMYKVFYLHRELLLGDIGKLILGIVGVVWTLNCLIGLYLTLPRKIKNQQPKHAKVQQLGRKKRASFIKRWLPAWKIRTQTNTFKLNYDLHQAFGLWLWGLLLVIAWSSVSFNLPLVYEPVMKAVTGYETSQQQTAKQQKAQQKSEQIKGNELLSTDSKNTDTKTIKALVGTAVLNDKQDSSYAVTKVNSIATLTKMAKQTAADNGVEVQQLLGMRWVAEDNQWQLRFKTDKDVGSHSGASSLTVDAKTGAIVRVNFGYQALLGNKVDHWLSALHMAEIGQAFWHVLYQLLLVIVGLAVTLLCITGTYLWLKGRQRLQKITAKIRCVEQ